MRHERHGRRLRGLAALVPLTAAGAIAFAMSPAQAAASTTDAQLAFTGVATKSNPTGGSSVGVTPGDSVRFSASSVPTKGLDALGLSLPASLGSLTDYTVKADFSKLPGGQKNTVLTGSKTATFTFQKSGNYSFTWTATAETTNVLGQKQTVSLDANELKQAGVKMNAHNQYVGTVTVATKSAGGGVAVQVPSIHVAPSASGVGKLPKVKVPGVQGPTVPVTVPSLPTNSLPVPVPGVGGSSSSSSSQHHKTSKPTHHTNGSGGTHTVHVPGETIPEQVMGGIGSTNTGGGVSLGSAGLRSGSGGRGIHIPAAGPVTSTAAAEAASSKPVHTVDLAAGNGGGSGNSGSGGSQVPTGLAIGAILALSLVTAGYARLYLLRRPTAH